MLPLILDPISVWFVFFLIKHILDLIPSQFDLGSLLLHNTIFIVCGSLSLVKLTDWRSLKLKKIMCTIISTYKLLIYT